MTPYRCLQRVYDESCVPSLLTLILHVRTDRFVVALSWYWLVFYKLQSKVFVLLPPSNNTIFKSFESMVYILWFCQLVRVSEFARIHVRGSARVRVCVHTVCLCVRVFVRTCVCLCVL